MLHKHTHPFIVSVTLLLTLLLPMTSVSQMKTVNGVTNLMLQAIPNAVSLSWNAPQGINVVTYYVHYAHTPLSETSRSDAFSIDTAGDVPSFILKDIADRGFTSGETMHIAITSVDENDTETPITEEQITTTIIPAGSLHAAADIPLRLLNAIAISGTQAKLEFSKEVQLPPEAKMHFTVTQEGTTDSIAVTQATAEGRIVTLTTLPMTPLKRYTVTAASTITGSKGEPLDEGASIAIFIGRGNPAAAMGGSTSSASTSSSSSSSSSISSVSSSSSSTQDQSSSASSESDTGQASSSSTSSALSSVSSISSTSSTSSASSQPEPEPEPPLIDTTPPEDATNLTLAKILQPDGNYTVKINWKSSANTQNDLKNYNLYESRNRGINFKGPTALAAVAVSATLTDVPPGTLTVKMTAQDRTNNESDGVEETIILPETGALSMLMLSIAGAGMWAGFGRKKRVLKC